MRNKIGEIIEGAVIGLAVASAGLATSWLVATAMGERAERAPSCQDGSTRCVVWRRG